MSKALTATALATSFVLMGCGAGGGTEVHDDSTSTAATAECAGPVADYASQFGPVSSVAGAYMSDAETVARWEETPRTPGGGISRARVGAM